MGDESQPVRVRASGAPLRCPFCHASVERDREEWVACHNCLAPHHAACWKESGACAGCGDTRSVAGSAPTMRAQTAPAACDERLAPVLELELRGRHAHFEGDTSFTLDVHPDKADETFELRVRNETEAPHRLELRGLPPWLSADPVLVPALATASLLLRVQLGAAPSLAKGTPVDWSFVLATDEDERSLRVDARIAPEVLRAWKRRRYKLATLAGILFVAYVSWLFHVREKLIDELEAHHGVATAVVTELTPSNHNQMYYNYVVDGVRYEKNDFSRVSKVGETFQVTYLLRDPSISVLDSDTSHVAMPGPYMIPFVVLMFATAGLVISGVMLGVKRPEPKRPA